MTADGHLQQRALLINYESLPGVIPKALLPLFGQEVSESGLRRMREESQPYSKSRGSRDETFSGDSRDKDTRATDGIRSSAEKILAPSYLLLDDLARKSYGAVMHSSAEGDSTSPSWAEVKAFPFRTAALHKLSHSDEHHHHSSVLDEQDFVSWLPFTNHHNSRPYHSASCPPIPTPDYPLAYNMLDVLNNWNADSNQIPPFHYDSLCHFDYQNRSELEAAFAYRAKEVPFVVYNIPEVDNVVRKWNDIRYLTKLLGSKAYRTETSKDNHFMYWSGGKKAKAMNWKPPTEIITTKFKDWLQVAVTGQNQTLENRKHQYFRVSSDANNDWLYEELPFFKPKTSLFIKEPREQRGIHCRFGMRSVISEAHFDGSRNAVVMLGGLRRWILAHPDQCKNMHMLQRPHPSARHSAVDWSKPDIEKYPNFAKVTGNEVILQPGDMLFVPTVWVHYIVSLNVNFQCNTRSGIFHGYDNDIKECGF